MTLQFSNPRIFTMKKNAQTLLAVAALLVALGGCSASGGGKSAGEYIDDATISTRVKARLIEDDQVKAREVTVETYRGVVQLSGFVSSEAEAARAVERARSVPGVTGVKNDIRIKPAP